MDAIVPPSKVADAAGSPDPVSDMSNRILEIIYEYALNKFEQTAVKHAAGHPKFMAVVNKFVSEKKPVLMCLPAFPFKSANKAYKVFGTLPDKAEEIALDRLNSMCKRITAIYPPGAQLTIISDGLVYNGTLRPRRMPPQPYQSLALPSSLRSLGSLHDCIPPTWQKGQTQL